MSNRGAVANRRKAGRGGNLAYCSRARTEPIGREMAATVPTGATDLRWIKTSRFARDYVLRDAAGTAHAHLEFERLFGRQAIARANGHDWRFSATGWLRPRVIVMQAGSDTVLAELTMRWLGWAGRGMLSVGEGRWFDWAATSIVTDRRWAFSDATSGLACVVFERPLLAQAGNKDLLCGRLTIDPSFKTDRAADLLTVLAMYLNG